MENFDVVWRRSNNSVNITHWYILLMVPNVKHYYETMVAILAFYLKIEKIVEIPFFYLLLPVHTLLGFLS